MNKDSLVTLSARRGRLIRDQINRAAPGEPAPAERAGGHHVPPGKYSVFVSCRSQTLPLHSQRSSAKTPEALSVCTAQGYGPSPRQTTALRLLSSPDAFEHVRGGSGQSCLPPLFSGHFGHGPGHIRMASDIPCLSSSP